MARWASFFFIPWLASTAWSSDTLRYQLIDLGRATIGNSIGRRINSANTVVLDGEYYWTTRDGLVHIPVPSGFTKATGRDVNDMGQIALSLTSGSSTSPGIFDPSSGATRLTMPQGLRHQTTSAVNASSWIVGSGLDFFNRAQAWLYRPGLGIKSLGLTPQGLSTGAFDVNDWGDVLGMHAVMEGGVTHFRGNVWQGGSTFVDFAAPPGTDFYPVALNNLGQSCGSTASPSRSLIHEPDDSYLDLGDLQGKAGTSAPCDINDSGWVVGSFTTSAGENAYLWRPGTGMVDLNTLVQNKPDTWSLRRAVGLSPTGSITGFASVSNDGFQHAFLLVAIRRSVGG